MSYQVPNVAQQAAVFGPQAAQYLNRQPVYGQNPYPQQLVAPYGTQPLYPTAPGFVNQQVAAWNNPNIARPAYPVNYGGYRKRKSAKSKAKAKRKRGSKRKTHRRRRQ